MAKIAAASDEIYRRTVRCKNNWIHIDYDTAERLGLIKTPLQEFVEGVFAEEYPDD